jgi:lipopolysaccharide/colanic/teichoic acid biosynthesis glycosyltransferase
MQRFFDIFFSLIVLIFLSPFFLILILILKLTGEGEVFFTQNRIGQHLKPFRLYKFVTMEKNSPNVSSGTITIKNDPRILPVGKFLRKAKINELPQLINVLFGDMSLVGPRPLTSQTFNLYDSRHKKIITKVKPGLSGIGSVIFRNEEDLLHNEIKGPEFYKKTISQYKGLVEVWYINHANLKNYFKIIFITIWVIVFPSSINFFKMFPGLPKPPPDLDLLIFKSYI